MGSKPGSNYVHEQRVLACARFFRRHGFSPLPAYPDDKRPALDEYRCYRERPLEPEWFERPEPWTNMQLLTGVSAYGARKLIVVDCDGELARERIWPEMVAANEGDDGPVSRTWVARTQSGGRHFYFLLPSYATECKSRQVWGLWSTWGNGENREKGGWLPKNEIRILGDKALVMAPPSVLSAPKEILQKIPCNSPKEEENKSYGFIDGKCPKTWALPSTAPNWVLSLAGISLPSGRSEPQVQHRWTRPSDGPALLADKIGTVRQWGVKTVGEPDPNGWVKCHVPWRRDNSPSGSFNATTGVLFDHARGDAMGMAKLGVTMGVYPDLAAALRSLGN
jgi:hypothetical protein